MNDENLKLEDLLSAKSANEESDRIEYVAIIGAGLMGQGIAQTISSSGLDVLIIEQSEDIIKSAELALKKTMEREIARWAMTNSEMKSILSRIQWSTDLNLVAECDLVIEAIEENLEKKQNLFGQLGSIIKEECILVSNTSTLSLTKIAEATERRDNIIGVHFLNPVPKIPLVELVKGYETSEKTVEIMKCFAKVIGKTAVEVFEFPGFVTTRAIVPLLNEAMHILLEGIASAKDIDTAMKLGYNFQNGPLELADQMGLDRVLDWMENLWNALGEPRYRPCPILRKLVRERKLGLKTGEGFYKYGADGKIITEEIKQVIK
ncbi:MAG: 3-hydroxybutyryl-CoA dehydrogenase [Melioribacteraceae bacterium]|nr:3-hydroxybutyryl-CoA dehydrogenase [Melioribacteraceae bacterium]